MLKKFFAVTIAALILILPFGSEQKANATQTYGRVITEDVGFYKDCDASELLFYLPYTYYVKITEYGESVSRVELFTSSSLFPAVDGYVYTNSLYFEDSTPISPFYELTLTTATATPFYKNSSTNTVMRYIFEDRLLYCYGFLKSYDGSYLYYVCYNGSLGYVKEECVCPFTFVYHPTPLPVFNEPTEDTETPEPKQNETNEVIKVAIIIAIALAAVVILIFALKPEKKDKEVAFYDDNDYD